MIKVGITGPSGFIATHLRNALGLHKDKYSVVPLARSYFQDQDKLRDFVTSCDVLVHLAALNRHHNPYVINETNMALVKSLIAALEGTGAKPHVIFSSSIQEAREHAFGKSKREGRELLSAWAEQSGGTFTGMIIPNVFGPFGRPYYNSVVATFCHQLTHGETPVIETDNELPLIYIGELVEEIDTGHGAALARTRRCRSNPPSGLRCPGCSPPCRATRKNISSAAFSRGCTTALSEIYSIPSAATWILQVTTR